MTNEPACAVCGGPGRYVRAGIPAGFCSDHAPAATPPWIILARVLALLAVAILATLKLLGRFA